MWHSINELFMLLHWNMLVYLTLKIVDSTMHNFVILCNDKKKKTTLVNITMVRISFQGEEAWILSLARNTVSYVPKNDRLT